MRVRPSIKHYCEGCGDSHDGRAQQTAPMFYVGCCFDLNWEGTRDQAGELYDYLVKRGYLSVRPTCAAGCIDTTTDQSEINDYAVWVCGECGAEFDEDDYTDAKAVAIQCCAPTPDDDEEPTRMVAA